MTDLLIVEIISFDVSTKAFFKDLPEMKPVDRKGDGLGEAGGDR